MGEWYEDRPDHVRAVAVWSGTTFAEPFEYCLQGTPCANVVGHRFCLYGSDVQRLFPDDDLLVERKVESYCGMPLFDHLGKPLGLLVVMDEMAMSDSACTQDVLSIFAGRAASELERTRIENERAKAFIRTMWIRRRGHISKDNLLMIWNCMIWNCGCGIEMVTTAGFVRGARRSA